MTISENHIFQKSNPLITMLPKVRGRYTEYVEMSPFTWFRVGGMAEVVFRPADAAVSYTHLTLPTKRIV